MVTDAERAPRTLFEKIWARHRILEREDGQNLLYVDRHLLQDGSAPAFEMLRQHGLTPRAPHRAFATPDHYVPTDSRSLAAMKDPEKRAMAEALLRDTVGAGIVCFGLEDPRQGIVHVVGPDGESHAFHSDPFPKHCLLQGLDELGYTLSLAGRIADFERRYERGDA